MPQQDERTMCSGKTQTHVPAKNLPHHENTHYAKPKAGNALKILVHYLHKRAHNEIAGTHVRMRNGEFGRLDV